MADETFEVVVVGAGLSGVGAGCHFAQRRPAMRYVVLESRERIGGTWDLFRYPGIRSDSDMFTLGFGFKPWRSPNAIAGGAEIRAYIEEAAREYGVDKHIRFGCKVARADWSSKASRWTVEVADRAGGLETYSAKFLLLAAGYYRYEAGHTPEFLGIADFRGEVVHPQQWTEQIAYAGKKVLVIGSGATAVTLVPALAEQAAHVTMLQRSPTYIGPRPSADPIADALRKRLPERAAYALNRWRSVLRGQYLFWLCKRYPARVRKLLADAAYAYLGADYDVGKHFTPRYNPWDQRLCLAPDGDFYLAIRKGRADVVTDEIETFTEYGVRLKSGEEISADLVVTATGLELQSFGGIKLSVDGAALEPGALTTYRGYMYAGVPNLASIFGYVNASWTLRADLISEQVCRLLTHMERRDYASCTPRLDSAPAQHENWEGFSSGYFARAQGRFPKQGAREPWRLNQNYLKDWFSARIGRLEDGVLQFASNRT
jgi:cation diffusion facilitator CzcD-associated flavoprotein CzcO